MLDHIHRYPVVHACATGKTWLKGKLSHICVLKNYLGIHGNQKDLQISMAVWLCLDLLAAEEKKREQKKRGYENTRKAGINGKEEKKREGREGKEDRKERREQKRRQETKKKALLTLSLNTHHPFDKPNKAKWQLRWLF